MPIKENQCKITIGNENLEQIGDDCKTNFFSGIIKLQVSLTKLLGQFLP